MSRVEATADMERQLDSRTEQQYRVSALVSVYNSSIYLDGLMRDLLSQTLYARNELEIVLVDSHSPDAEDWAIIERYAASHPHIRAIRTHERESLYMAWNRAIAEARGSYLTNANTDDRHAVNGLEVLANELDRHPGIDLVHADVLISRVPNAPFHEVPPDEPFHTPTSFAPGMLLYFGFGPQPMWRRTVHDRIGVFNGEMKAAGDWDFGLRLVAQCRTKRAPQVLGAFLVTENNISFRDSTMQNESLEVMNRWQTDENVERLYLMEGISASTDVDRARIHLDMGVRALEFVNPLGGRRRHLQFALTRFQRALQFVPDWSKAVNNIGVTFALAGQVDQAAKLFEAAGRSQECPEAGANARRLADGIAQMEIYGGFRPSSSGLSLPSTFDLAAGREWEAPIASGSGLEDRGTSLLIPRKVTIENS